MSSRYNIATIDVTGIIGATIAGIAVTGAMVAAITTVIPMPAPSSAAWQPVPLSAGRLRIHSAARTAEAATSSGVQAVTGPIARRTILTFRAPASGPIAVRPIEASTPLKSRGGSNAAFFMR